MRKQVTRQEKGHIRQILHDQLMQREEVRFAYLFGSFTLEGGFNDIDVAVFVDSHALQNADPLTLSFMLADVLERAVGLPVDVVILNVAPLALQFEATRAELLMARDAEEVGEFVEGVTLRW